LEKEIEQVDAVWLIAPESDGALMRMTVLAEQCHKTVIGCGTQAITAFSSKLKTFQLLSKAGIATLSTYVFSDWFTNVEPKSEALTWLAKPDDGAGCEETVYFNHGELVNWVKEHHKEGTHVVQPYVRGTPASIACVVHQGKAQVLSCNTQLLSTHDSHLHYEGCVINGMQAHWEAFEVIANKVACLLPDISAYIGIDVIVQGEGAQLIVVEVNPRLTMSYIALHKATGINPAALVMQHYAEDDMTVLSLEKNIIQLTMEQPHG